MARSPKNTWSPPRFSKGISDCEDRLHAKPCGHKPYKGIDCPCVLQGTAFRGRKRNIQLCVWLNNTDTAAARHSSQWRRRPRNRHQPWCAAILPPAILLPHPSRPYPLHNHLERVRQTSGLLIIQAIIGRALDHMKTHHHRILPRSSMLLEGTLNKQIWRERPQGEAHGTDGETTAEKVKGGHHLVLDQGVGARILPHRPRS